jgi:hypothetical protein
VQLRGIEIVAPVPVMYLIGRSIELTLKAFLLHRGVTLGELRLKFGHDLEECFKKAEQLGLPQSLSFSVEELGAFQLLKDLYSTKQLEYIVTGARKFPFLRPLESFAEKLFKSIGPMVEYTGRLEKPMP